MQYIRSLLFLIFFVWWVNAQTQPLDLGVVLAEPAKWSLCADDFMTEFQQAGFRFMDGKHSVVSNQKTQMLFLGQELLETRVYFEQQAICRVELSIYNKGDAGAKNREAFEALVTNLKAKIGTFAQDKGMSGKTTSERANYVVNRHQWAKKTPAIQLEWAYVDAHRSGGKSVAYGAEYITVVMVPLKAGGSEVTAVTGGLATKVVKNARMLKENVARHAEGDVWVENVPMVDQGQKGYCAAATAERVMRYYGIQIDQHQIAQLANTAAESGTTLEGIAKAVTKFGRQFQLDKKDLIAIDADDNFERSEHVKLINQYNAVAKKKKMTVINWKEYTTGNMVDLPSIWMAMDPKILLEARASQTQGLNQFSKNISVYVEQGVPLLWACLVGMFPEEPALMQVGAFGHVRLIIGYNAKTREVLYSDSWGPSHTLKRLPLDQAWAMTKGLIVLKPRDVR